MGADRRFGERFSPKFLGAISELPAPVLIPSDLLGRDFGRAGSTFAPKGNRTVVTRLRRIGVLPPVFRG